MLNISLGYKSDGRLSTATLPITKEMISSLMMKFCLNTKIKK